jgi:hypothetical protein
MKAIYLFALTYSNNCGNDINAPDDPDLPNGYT